MRITNERGWGTLPGEAGSLCTFECRVFLFYLDSCFESFRVLLDVSRLCAVYLLVESFAVFSRRLDTRSRAHLSISK